MSLIERVRSKPFLFSQCLNYVFKNGIESKNKAIFPIRLPKYMYDKYLICGNYRYADKREWDIMSRGIKINYLDVNIGNKHDNISYLDTYLKYFYLDEYYNEVEIKEKITYSITRRGEQKWNYCLRIDDELAFQEIKSNMEGNKTEGKYKLSIFDNLDYELYEKIRKSIN